MFINLYKKVISNQNRPYNADDYITLMQDHAQRQNFKLKL